MKTSLLIRPNLHDPFFLIDSLLQTSQLSKLLPLIMYTQIKFPLRNQRTKLVCNPYCPLHIWNDKCKLYNLYSLLNGKMRVPKHVSVLLKTLIIQLPTLLRRASLHKGKSNTTNPQVLNHTNAKVFTVIG